MFTGSKNRACDRESRADHGKREWSVPTDTFRDEQRRQGRDNIDSGEVQEATEEDEASNGWTDHLIRNVYQCVETESEDTGIRSGWQSTGWLSGFARKRKWDKWICGID